MENKKSIMTSGVFILLTVFALVKPDSLPYIGLGAFENFLIIFDVFLAIVLIIKLPKYKISTQTIGIIIMYVFLIIPTIINTDNYYLLLITIGPTFAACMFTDYCMQKNPLNYIKYAMISFDILFTINLFSIIFFPGGLYESNRIRIGNYFMGYDNGFIYMLLPYVGFALIYSVISKGKLLTFHSLYAILLTTLTELLVWSGTGVILVVLMNFCILAYEVPFVKKILEPRLLVSLFFIATFLIVFLRITDIFAPIIVDVLGKDLTFTGRTFLWDSALKSISENFFMGVGQCGYTVAGKIVIGKGQYFAMHPHCLILDLLYKGGIFMFSVFVYVIVHFTLYVKKWIKYPSAKIILMVVVCILFGEIANSGQFKPFFWAFIVMASYIPELSGLKLESKEFVRIKVR